MMAPARKRPAITMFSRNDVQPTKEEWEAYEREKQLEQIRSIGMKLAAFICRLRGCDVGAISEKVRSEGVALANELIQEFKRISEQERKDSAVCYCGLLMRDHHQGSSCTMAKPIPESE